MNALIIRGDNILNCAFTMKNYNWSKYLKVILQFKKNEQVIVKWKIIMYFIKNSDSPTIQTIDIPEDSTIK